MVTSPLLSALKVGTGEFLPHDSHSNAILNVVESKSFEILHLLHLVGSTLIVDRLPAEFLIVQDKMIVLG